MPTAKSPRSNDRERRPDTPSSAAAFGEAVVEHQPHVSRFLSHLTRDAERTDRLATDTFARAFERLETFRPGSNMRAWLLRVAYNLYRDEQRQFARESTRRAAIPPEGVAAPGSHDPAAIAAHRESLNRIARQLEELSPMQRAVFTLVVEQGLTHAAVADVLGISATNSRYHLIQARRELLESLGDTDMH